MKTKLILLSFFTALMAFRAHSEPNECIYSIEREISCNIIQNNPFGKISQQKKYTKDGELVFVRFEGAYSGIYLFPDISIYYGEKNGWWLGNLNKILLRNLSPHTTYTFQHNNEPWQLKVEEIKFPTIQKGIATEDVNQITFSISKIIK